MTTFQVLHEDNAGAGALAALEREFRRYFGKRPGNAVLLTMRQSGSNSERCFYRADLEPVWLGSFSARHRYMAQ